MKYLNFCVDYFHSLLLAQKHWGLCPHKQLCLLPRSWNSCQSLVGQKHLCFPFPCAHGVVLFQGPQRPKQMGMDSHKCMELPFPVCLSACFPCFSLPIALPSWKSPTLPLSYSFLDPSTLSLHCRKALQFHLMLSISSSVSCGAALLCCEIQLRTDVLLLPCSQMSPVAGAGTQDSVQAWEPRSSSRSSDSTGTCWLSPGVTLQHESFPCCKDSSNMPKFRAFLNLESKTQIKTQLNESWVY